MVSRLVAPSFSLANSLISTDVLQRAKVTKNTFSKVNINISCNKSRLETENIFSARRINCEKTKTTIKTSGSVTYT